MRNHKHKHAQNGIFDSVLDTSSPQPNDKQDGGRSFSYVRMRSWSKWPMIGPRPCAHPCTYVDPVLTSQSYDISISTSTNNELVPFFVCLCLCLCRPSLTCLHMWLCLCLCASSESQTLALTSPLRLSGRASGLVNVTTGPRFDSSATCDAESRFKRGATAVANLILKF